MSVHGFEQDARVGVPISNPTVSVASDEPKVGGNVGDGVGGAKGISEKEIGKAEHARLFASQVGLVGRDRVHESLLGHATLARTQPIQGASRLVLAFANQSLGQLHQVSLGLGNIGKSDDFWCVPFPDAGRPICTTEQHRVPGRHLCRSQILPCPATRGSFLLACAPVPDIGHPAKWIMATRRKDVHRVQKHGRAPHRNSAKMRSKNRPRLAIKDLPDPALARVTAGHSVLCIGEDLHRVHSVCF
mmetsp:Transcript_27331/g.59403  ORF Transcript_27331/g.59403 Transcript_27331/m.59403 type:complete len:245 (+) Transcript_27331:514-1248(+)